MVATPQKVQRKRQPKRGLVTDGAPAEIGVRQVLPGVFQLVVGQHPVEARSGELAILVVDDPAPPRRQVSPANRAQRLVVRSSECLQKLDERVLALRPDRVVDVRCIQRRVRTDGRKGAAPDDRHRGRFLADGLRHGDCREQLRAAHDGDTHGGDGALADGS